MGRVGGMWWKGGCHECSKMWGAERSDGRERQREARADERNDGAKNRVVVGMVTLVVSFSGVVFAREREEDTQKKTKKTTTNGRRNYLNAQKSAFANARCGF